MPLPLIAAGFGSLIAAGATYLMVPAFNRFVSQQTNYMWENEPADLYSLLKIHWAFPDLRPRADSLIHSMGYSNKSLRDMLLGQTRYPTIEEIMRLYLLGLIDKDKAFKWVSPTGKEYTWGLYDFLRSQNVPQELGDLFTAMVSRPLSMDSAVRLYRRFGEYEPIPDPSNLSPSQVDPVKSSYGDLFQRTKRYEGFKDMPDKTILDAWRVYPGVDDYIRFAVREVYSPELAKSLSLYEDIPAKFLEEVRKIGLDPNDAVKYWASHWQLPSYTQGTEMYQRGIITNEELKSLLRALDYAPVWRDKMIKLSHRVVTRVDIRRMYNDGIIPKINPAELPDKQPEDRSKIPELIRRYMDMGYNYDDALALGKWTDKKYPSPVVEAALKQVTSAAKKGYLTTEQIKALLGKINIPEATREAILKSLIAQRDQNTIDTAVKRYVPLYLAGELSYAELEQLLTKLGLSQESIKTVVDTESVSYASKIHGLTEPQIIRLFKKGIIKTKSEASQMLMASGLVKKAADLLLQEAELGIKAKVS